MVNPKIQKLSTEIERLKTKISEYQARLRKLERQKTIMENDQIVALFRSQKISDAELSEVMSSIRNGTPITVPAQTKNEMEDNTYEDDTQE
jgi:predicted  nucleic acid-binding Zn-ribbon protein